MSIIETKCSLKDSNYSVEITYRDGSKKTVEIESQKVNVVANPYCLQRYIEQRGL